MTLENYKADKQYVDDAISQTVDRLRIGFDYVNLSLIYSNKANATKIAEFFVKYGLNDQYASFLALNNEVDLKQEFERVKKYDKCYLAIANYLKGEDRKYCQSKVMEIGTSLEVLKYMLSVDDADKIELSKCLVRKGNVNSIGYALKYIDDDTLLELKDAQVHYNGGIKDVLNSMLDIIQNGTSDFAKTIAFLTIRRVNNLANIKSNENKPQSLGGDVNNQNLER